MAQAPGTRPVTAALAALALACCALPQAAADDLSDDRDRIAREQAAARSNVADFSSELNRAADTLQRSQQELAAARKELDAATRQREQAQQRDRALAKQLATARQELKQATSAVAKNQKALDAELKLVGATVRETHQQNTELMGIAAFVTQARTADVNQRLQWSDTIFNATQVQMDRLNDLQDTLEAARAKQARAEQQVSRQRTAAASQLTQRLTAEARADSAASSVSELVSANASAKQAVAGKLDAEQKRQAALDGEAAAVLQRINARIARQKAAAQQAERAAARATQLAQQAREAAKRRQADAAAKQAAASKAHAQAKKAGNIAATTPTSSPARDQQANYSAGRFFDMPVDGPVSSRFGRRFHPVLKVWKLHDGMDYAAGCGAPIRATRDGVVSEVYFNVGYGNRLILDHGIVDGAYLTTSYNHATGYTVAPGQKVSRGQVIGHVGTTGFSTGCHLHLMVWRDGVLVDPGTVF